MFQMYGRRGVLRDYLWRRELRLGCEECWRGLGRPFGLRGGLCRLGCCLRLRRGRPFHVSRGDGTWGLATDEEKPFWEETLALGEVGCQKVHLGSVYS